MSRGTGATVMSSLTPPQPPGTDLLTTGRSSTTVCPAPRQAHFSGTFPVMATKGENSGLGFQTHVCTDFYTSLALRYLRWGKGQMVTVLYRGTMNFGHNNTGQMCLGIPVD